MISYVTFLSLRMKKALSEQASHALSHTRYRTDTAARARVCPIGVSLFTRLKSPSDRSFTLSGSCLHTTFERICLKSVNWVHAGSFGCSAQLQTNENFKSRIDQGGRSFLTQRNLNVFASAPYSPALSPFWDLNQRVCFNKHVDCLIAIGQTVRMTITCYHVTISGLMKLRCSGSLRGLAFCLEQARDKKS